MKKLFYCCLCLVGTYERDLLLWDDDLPNHWPEGTNKEGHHCIHEWSEAGMGEDLKWRKEFILAHLLEDGKKGWK